jgi:hypothetical protein
MARRRFFRFIFSSLRPGLAACCAATRPHILESLLVWIRGQATLASERQQCTKKYVCLPPIQVRFFVASRQKMWLCLCRTRPISPAPATGVDQRGWWQLPGFQQIRESRQVLVG